MVRLTHELIEKIKSSAQEFKDVAFLAVAGSIATRGVSVHDIDIAVKAVGDNKYDTLCKFISKLSQTLGIPEDAVDIVDMDRADIDFKARVIREGIIVIDKGYSSKLLSEIASQYGEHREYLDISLREWLYNPETIDVAVAKRRLDFVKEELEFLKEHILSKSLEEVASSPILRRLIERSFQLIIEALIDICRHIASVKGWLKEYTAREAINQCAKHKVIVNEIAKTLNNIIILRNIIIHRYLDIDYEKLYKEAKELTNTAREFEKNIVKYLKREKVKHH